MKAMIMQSNSWRMEGPTLRDNRTPNFDSGIISEPMLMFGGGHRHVDPKTGIALYGPYSLQGQTRAPLRSITVGIVGPPPMIADAEAWLQGCKGMLTNDGSQPFLYPHFPGLNTSHPFECELLHGEAWREPVRDSDIGLALARPTFEDQVSHLVDLYVNAVEVLATNDPKPDVVVCCIPQEVVDKCAVRRTGAVIRRARRPSRFRRVKEQLELFQREIDEGESGHQNLRRGLKADAMQFGMPTQLVWPSTLRLSDRVDGRTPRRQDIATRAWNFTTALYHKAGGSPWRLAELEPGLCFVGISFYREISGESPGMRTSMAQAFTAAGDGYVLRGNTFEWGEEKGRSPHLTKELAASLLRDVIELYKRQNRGSLPSRIVVHKSSRFWEEELEGIEEATNVIPRKDLVALGYRGLQFYRTGDYPALRGTYVKFSERDLLLYTTGYIPYLRTYPGARVPQPLEVLEHHGDSPWDVVLREVLALTKMNWNTADFACSEPITIAFSRRVGQILAEVPQDSRVQPEYKFYM